MTNDNQELKQAFIDITNLIAQEDGWCNLSDFGGALRLKRIKYGKLSRFLKDHEELFDFKTDTEIDPPVKYVRLKSSVTTTGDNETT